MQSLDKWMEYAVSLKNYSWRGQNKTKAQSFLARLLILIKKGGLLQLKFGVVGVGVNIYLWAR